MCDHGHGLMDFTTPADAKGFGTRDRHWIPAGTADTTTGLGCQHQAPSSPMGTAVGVLVRAMDSRPHCRCVSDGCQRQVRCWAGRIQWLQEQTMEGATVVPPP